MEDLLRMVTKERLENDIERLNKTLGLLKFDMVRVSSDIARQAIQREIAIYEKSLERKEFKLWKLEKEGN